MYIYLFGTKIVETIDTAAARQTALTLCRAVLFKAIKQPQRCHQNRFRKIAATAVDTVSKQSQTNKISYCLLHQHKPVLYHTTTLLIPLNDSNTFTQLPLPYSKFIDQKNYC